MNRTKAKAKPGKHLPTAENKPVNKDKALGAAIEEIERSYGVGSIMRLGDQAGSKEMRGISTGSIQLDFALGGPGLPHGRVVEIYGPESSGKTTLTLHVIASAQKEGGICAFVTRGIL